MPDDDPVRCRYDDCHEQHPVAPEDDDGGYLEPITCATCREDMSLDPWTEPEPTVFMGVSAMLGDWP